MCEQLIMFGVEWQTPEEWWGQAPQKRRLSALRAADWHPSGGLIQLSTPERSWEALPLDIRVAMSVLLVEAGLVADYGYEGEPIDLDYE